MNPVGVLENVVVGDDYDIERTVPGVPDGTTLALAWVTIKKTETAADPGIIQKKISPLSQSGIGQITDVGTTGTGTILFQLTAADTLLLVPNRKYYYDIQVKTASGKIYTVEIGRVQPLRQITVAQS